MEVKEGTKEHAEMMRARTLEDVVYEAAECASNCALKDEELETFVRDFVKSTEEWKLLVRRDDLEMLQGLFADARRMASALDAGQVDKATDHIMSLAAAVGTPLKGERLETVNRVTRVLELADRLWNLRGTRK